MLTHYVETRLFIMNSTIVFETRNIHTFPQKKNNLADCQKKIIMCNDKTCRLFIN